MSGESIILEKVSKKFLLKSRSSKNCKGILKSFLVQEEFYALSDISLTILKSENIGLLGRNGAGKTLLLKIISGIVYPSCGIVDVKEAVSPIFEYGASFHPELTGQDHIFLYGSFLGIKKNEIRKNLDAIINFSELSNFLDFKLKHYSTGMRIKLAFSVASILQPEILILDEALSFGDQGFVKKVHSKVEELQNLGVTMLITSHSFEILKKFCKKGIVIDKGMIVYNGDINEAINYYKDEILLENRKGSFAAMP